MSTESACSAGGTGEGNGNPLQRSCLENPRDGAAWWAAVYGVTQSWARLKWLSSSSSRNRRHGLDPWIRKIPCRRKWQPTPVFLGFPGGSDDKESTCNAGDLGLISRLGRALVPWWRAWQPTSVFLSGEFPLTEELSGLQSLGSQRVRHDWVTKHIF